MAGSRPQPYLAVDENHQIYHYSVTIKTAPVNAFRELPLIILLLLFQIYIVYIRLKKIPVNRFRQIPINAQSSHRRDRFSSTAVSRCRRKSSDLSVLRYHQNRTRKRVSRSPAHNFITSISDIHHICQARKNSGKSLPADSHYRSIFTPSWLVLVHNRI